jgi:hypothetical protein
MALFKLTKQDRDYYALQDLLKPKEDQQEETAGIGTKPSKQEQDEEGIFSSFFGGLFDRSEQRAQEIAKEAKESALAARLTREFYGITKSLTEEDIAIRSASRDPMYGNKLPEETTLVDVTDTDMGKLTNVKPLEELSEAVDPGTIDVSDLPGKGLMSPRLDSKGEGPEKKQVLRPKLRPEGLDSLEEKERIKAVQTIIGTKADGAFGTNSKAKLKAWQYVHNVPTTGEIDEVTLSAMKNPDTYDPREIARDDFMLSKTFDLLKGVEGFEEDAYLGAISDKFKSGLTVGAGIDFGQHTKDSLLSKGLPKSLVEKANIAGWIGLNPDTVIDPDTGQPASQGRGTKAQRRARGKALLEAKVAEQKEDGTFPVFTYEELAASTPVMYSDYEKAAKNEYEREYGENTWTELKEGTKAVLSTEKYHRGVGYKLPESMLAGARTNNAKEAARGIANRGRRNNMTAWLKKVGLDS